MPKWSEEQKAKALTIAEAISISEAARQTGIPAGTIKRWRSEMNRTEPSEPNRTPKKLENLAEEAIQTALEEAKEYIVDRLKALADELYSLAEDSVKETRAFMAKPGEKNRDTAAWLRAVVGAMHYAIQDAQLLSGKPTVRPEVIDRHEYDITQRIITERPELIDEIFAQDQRQGLADRSS